MRVRVRLLGKLGKKIGSETTIELTNVTEIKVKDLFNYLIKKDSSLRDLLYTNGRLSRRLIILKNGHSVILNKGLDTTLTDNDLVSMDHLTILETVGGG